MSTSASAVEAPIKRGRSCNPKLATQSEKSRTRSGLIIPRTRTYRPRKLNPDRVIELKKNGLTNAEIAKSMGVVPSAVWRFLQTNSEEIKAVEAYKSGRADVLAKIQGMALDVQTRILASLDNRVLESLTPSQKSGMLLSVNTVYGTLYDKERLELGKSTQNVGLIARMMGDSLGRIGKATSNSGDPAPETPVE